MGAAVIEGASDMEVDVVYCLTCGNSVVLADRDTWSLVDV
jgi:hypothetical protein